MNLGALYLNNFAGGKIKSENGTYNLSEVKALWHAGRARPLFIKITIKFKGSFIR